MPLHILGTARARRFALMRRRVGDEHSRGRGRLSIIQAPRRDALAILRARSPLSSAQAQVKCALSAWSVGFAPSESTAGRSMGPSLAARRRD